MININSNIQHVYVVGCSRSGTTLLQSILATHPSALSLPETAFFQSMVGDSEHRMFDKEKKLRTPYREIRAKIRLAAKFTAKDLKKVVHETTKRTNRVDLMKKFPSNRTSYSNAARCFIQILDQISKDKKRTLWIEKTPSHVHFIAEILRYDPKAKIIHIIREGKEVAASLKIAGVRYPNAHWSKTYNTINRMVDRWNKAVNDSRNWLTDSRNAFVNFENLVTSPSASTRLICEFLNISFDPQMIGTREDSYSNIVGKNEPWKSGVSREICPIQPRFADTFSNEERDFISENLTTTSEFEKYYINSSSSIL